MRRVPIQKALTDQHLVYRSHVKRFWKHATYDEANKVIKSVVKQYDEKKPIIVSEALVREVVNFPDDANSPTKFPERMVKGCMLRIGYDGALNNTNYLKSKFRKPYRFIVYSVLQALSHCKGGYDAIRDYQMNMVTALVLNKKYNFSHIVFHYMVENITSKNHAYPDIERDVNNDLLVLSHMSNDSLKQLARYHPNHPEPKKVAEFFGFIKDANYVDPDPVNHQNWRNEEEMKEAGYADELEALKGFKGTRNDWFVKEHRKREEPEPEADVEVEPEVEAKAETEAEANIEIDVRLSPNSQSLLKKLKAFNAQKDKAAVDAQKEKAADDIEGDDVNKSTTSSSSSSEDEIDVIEREKRIQAEVEKEKQLRKRKRQEKDDDAYVPSPERVSESQSPPSGGRKKAGARKRIVSPKIKKVTQKIKKPTKIILKKKPTQKPSKPPSPPPEPTPHQSPIHSPLHQSPPRQPSPLHLSPPPQSPPQQIHSNLNIGLDEIGDFNWASNAQVKNVESKVDIVVAENKRLADRENILEMRVKKLESENKSLLKKIDADQTEIDILKVRVAELEEEKTRRDEQNKYFELKNKELEAAKALKEHEFYMMNKVIENMLGKSIEQRFEEIEVEEVRAKRQAETEAQMRDKGKSAEGSIAVSERSIVPSLVVENPVPISAVSAVFDEDVLLDDVITAEGDDEDDSEEDDDEEKIDDAYVPSPIRRRKDTQR
ncbi:glutamic acid-rich protein-like [Helianthus annuus]|uniref:glutamic acid-rich protein-like n=1 Tax=Helianthus annuus TaxID=4232 RepID=UPI000B906EAF|nr:glutamic acid-rich protein-like [Helianthus annuus]